ncbi:MAG: trehalose-phosphatase [Gammaproteobacteria bacterium]|jgi:alpha,alpha-trehalase|nr:trehalose-phosphatase [Gammaproteobacteria bacterium]
MTGLIADLPSALAHSGDIRKRLAGKRPAVFLDYDGTLTPIVDRPELAIMTSEMRATIRVLATVCPTAIVSGRGLADVAALVKLEELIYSGNHGFEISTPGTSTVHSDKGKPFTEAVAAISEHIAQEIADIDGAFVENKTYSLSVHYRLVAPQRVAEIEGVVDAALTDYPNLHKRHGKKVFEIRPKIDWDKGKAVLLLLQTLALDGPEVVPIYIGDDITDEDAFRALKGRGIGVLVGTEERESVADYILHDTDETQRFLHVLTDLARGSN